MWESAFLERICISRQKRSCWSRINVAHLCQVGAYAERIFRKHSRRGLCWMRSMQAVPRSRINAPLFPIISGSRAAERELIAEWNSDRRQRINIRSSRSARTQSIWHVIFNSLATPHPREGVFILSGRRCVLRSGYWHCRNIMYSL